jgi:hypothetical protein
VKEPRVKTNKPLAIKGHAERKTNFTAQGAIPVLFAPVVDMKNGGSLAIL